MMKGMIFPEVYLGHVKFKKAHCIFFEITFVKNSNRYLALLDILNLL